MFRLFRESLKTSFVVQFFHSDGKWDWPTLLAFNLIQVAGFSSLGALAGETRNPSKTFTRGLYVLIPTVLFVNAAPFLVSLSHNYSSNDYQIGFWQKLAFDLGGRSLQIALVFGGYKLKTIVIKILFQSFVIRSNVGRGWSIHFHDCCQYRRSTSRN